MHTIEGSNVGPDCMTMSVPRYALMSLYRENPVIFERNGAIYILVAHVQCVHPTSRNIRIGQASVT